MNDGSIRVGTKLDTKETEVDLKKLEKECEQTAQKIEQAGAKIKTVFTGASKGQLNSAFKTANKELEKTEAVLAAVEDKIKGIQAETDKSLTDSATPSQTEQLLKMEEDETAPLLKQRDELTAKAAEYKQKLEAITAELNKQADTEEKVKGKVGETTGAVNALTARVADTGNTMHKAFDKGIKKIGRLVIAVLGARGAYMVLRRAISSCMEGNEELSQKINAIWNALGTIIEPVVVGIINVLYKFIAYVNYLVKALTGIDFVANANAKALNKQATATKKLTQATKEANKQLAAFDEMNVLREDTGTSAIDSGQVAATLDLPELTDEEKENLNFIAGIFQVLGNAIQWVIEKCTTLKDWWLELDDTTKELIITLGVAGLIGILVSGLSGWSLVGAIGAAVLAIMGLNDLINGDTTDALNGLIMLFGAAGLIGILIGGTTGLTVCGAIMSVSLALAGLNLMINGDTTEAIGGLILLLGGAGLAGYLWKGAKGLTLGIAVGSAMAIISGFNDLLSGDTDQAIRGAIKILVGSAGLVLAFTALKNIINGASGVNAVLTALKSPLFICVAGFAVLAAGILYLAKNWDKMSGAQRAITILSGLAAAAAAAAIAIAIFHTSWTVGVAAAAIAGGVALLGLTFAFTSKDKGSLEKTGQEMANSFYSSSNFNGNPMPKLARGAIVNNPGRGVPVIAGEAGSEAILPLDNNTEWMDTLAEKINGGAARIVIPIYLHGRKIAEEIIDLTKQRNFATNGAF